MSKTPLLRVGQILNSRYKIEGLPKQTNNARVYPAVDIHDEQPCIVKQNLDGTELARQRIERESTILQKVGSHTNIPRYSDCFRLGQSALLVMQAIDGNTLDELLRQPGRGRPWRSPLLAFEAVGCPVCEILVHLADLGIAHGDVTPKNLIVRNHEEGAADIVLIDFSSARLEDRTGPVGSTQPGTLGYFDGNSVPDQRRDIYAVGALLYEMLTGHRPARPGRVKPDLEYSGTEQLDADQWEKVTEPVRVALAPRESGRYQTVQEFLDALIQARDSLRMLPDAPPVDPPGFDKLADIWAENAAQPHAPPAWPIAMWASAIVMLILALGIGAYHLINIQITNSQTIAQRATAQAETNARATAESDTHLQQTEAQAQIRVAFSRGLAAQAGGLLNERLDLGLLLAIEAYRIDSNPETRNGLLLGLQHSPRLMTFLNSFPSSVAGIAFSPSGKIMASAGGDRTIILWDVSNPASPVQLGSSPPAHNNFVYDVVFSPDGKTLASSGGDNNIVLWDVSNPAVPSQLGSPLAGHTNYGLRLAFSPNGKMLASGSEDTTIILWDVSNPASPEKVGPPLSGHKDWVWSVAFSPDGNTLASGSKDGSIILWDISNSAAPKQIGLPLGGHGGAILSIAFHPNGKVLASGGEDTTVNLWNITDLSSPVPLGGPLSGHTAKVNSVAFSPDGKTMASGSDDKSIILWDVSDPTSAVKVIPPLYGHGGIVFSVAFSPDGRSLASASGDHSVIMWDVSNPTLPEPLGSRLVDQQSGVFSVAFGPDGKTLASSNYDGTITLWSVTVSAAPTKIVTLSSGRGNSVSNIAFSPNGNSLAIGKNDGTIILWDVSNPEAPIQAGSPILGHRDFVKSVAFSPDGKTLAAGSFDNSVSLWNISNLKSPVRLSSSIAGPFGSILSVAFSPDGKTLAMSSSSPLSELSRGSVVLLWDISNPALPVQLGSPIVVYKDPGYVESVAFSPDGTILAIGGAGNSFVAVVLWNVSNRASPIQLGPPLSGHTLGVSQVAFSSDGKILASASIDKSVVIWDISKPASPVQIGDPFFGHNQTVTGVAFSPDGRTLASSSFDSTIVLWDLSIESWVARACRIAHRNLTRAEWAQYLKGEPYQQICAQWPEGN